MHPIKAAETELKHIAATLEDEGHHLAGRLHAAIDALKTDEPRFAHDAETDAADIATTAATKGLVPAEQEAVKDAGELAVEAADDVAKAAESA